MTSSVARDLATARRLEWWTLLSMATVLAVMTFASSGSEAFRTALIEDWLSLVPAIVFLIAARIERMPPSRRFPFGFDRANSLAFLIAAVALAAVGISLLIESVMSLVQGEHPSVPPMQLFGHEVWSGWVMVAALAYSVIPPLILGRLKEPVARRLHDKVLHTDALMQKADWQTGLAGIVGIVGIGFGLWWLDAAAAIFIAFSIVADGFRSLTSATAELLDGTPRALESDAIADDAVTITHWAEQRFPGADIQLREVGRVIHAVVAGMPPPPGFRLEDEDIPELKDRWRLERIAFSPSRDPGPGDRASGLRDPANPL